LGMEEAMVIMAELGMATMVGIIALTMVAAIIALTIATMVVIIGLGMGTMGGATMDDIMGDTMAVGTMATPIGDTTVETVDMDTMPAPKECILVETVGVGIVEEVMAVDMGDNWV